MVAKRGSAATKASQAKRVKTSGPEGPLLAFLASAADMPKSSREMLQVALPLCLETAQSDRHKFQVEVLERISGLLEDAENKKREALAALEASVADMQVQNDSAAASVESKKALSAGKKAECDAKGLVVDEARAAEKDAQGAVNTAQEQAAGFQSKRTDMFAEQEAFAKLLSEGFQPLKEGSFAGNWQKRNKVIAELQKKLLQLGSQQSLADAMAAALKRKPEDRDGAFAKAAMQFVETEFNKYTEKLSQDVSGLDAEEANIKAAGVSGEAALAAKKEERERLEKEWDEMQDVWVKLEEDVANAANSAKSIEVELPDLKESVEEAKAELEEHKALQALFLKLREQTNVVPELPPPEEEPEPEAPGADATVEAA